MNLPAHLEKLIWEGRAKFKTIIVGGDNLNVVTIPQKTFWVLLKIGYTPPYTPASPFLSTANSTNTINALNPANTSSNVMQRLQIADKRGLFFKRPIINPYDTAVVQNSADANFWRFLRPIKHEFEVYEPITDFCSIAAGIVLQNPAYVRNAAASWNFPEVAMHNPYVQSGTAVTNVDTIGGVFLPFGEEITRKYNLSGATATTDEITPPGVGGFAPLNATSFTQGPFIELSLVEVYESIPNTLA